MAKERSPNYPAIGLAQALQLAKQLYEKERRAVVPVDVVATALGYSSKDGKLSGNALSRIAALRQYGLVEKAAQGKLRVSERTIDLVLGQPTDTAYANALRGAALAPSLFRELAGDHGDASDDALRVHLIRDRGFSSPEAANRVIKSFRDTMAFAKLTPGSYNGEGDGAEIGDSDFEEQEETAASDGSQKREIKKRQPPRGGQGVSYSWPLGNGNSVELVFAVEPTRANIDILLAQLQIVRGIAPDQPTAQTPKEETYTTP